MILYIRCYVCMARIRMPDMQRVAGSLFAETRAVKRDVKHVIWLLDRMKDQIDQQNKEMNRCYYLICGINISMSLVILFIMVNGQSSTCK